MLSEWPSPVLDGHFAQEAFEVGQFQEVVGGIRDLRSRLGLKPADRLPEVYVVVKSKKASETLLRFRKEILAFGRVKELFLEENFKKQPGMVGRVYQEFEIFVGGLSRESLEREKERTRTKIAELERSIQSISGRLENPTFVSKAPEEVVQAEKERKQKFEGELASYRENLSLFVDHGTSLDN